jgi:hypothetical protein
MSSHPLATEWASRLGVPAKTLTNLYFEPTPQGPREYSLRGRPGLYRPAVGTGMSAALGSGPVYLIEQVGLVTYVLSGTDLYRNGIDIGNLAAGSYQQAARSASQFVIVSGNNAYLVDTVATQITDADLPDVSGVIFLGGYWIFPETGTSRYYYSAVDDATSIDALSFASAEVSPDTILRIVDVAGQAWIFGEESIEYASLTGNADSPLRAVSSRSQSVGCLAAMSVVPADNGVFFMGQDRGTGRGFFRTDGLEARRISTPSIDAVLDADTGANLILARSVIVYQDGHQFFLTNIPNVGSFAYDIASGRWAKWETYDADPFRIISGDGVYFGDEDGNIFRFASTTYDDDDDALVRTVSCFIPHEGNGRHNHLVLQCATGVGLASGQGSAPVVEMRWSDDLNGGWSAWQSASLGVMGDYDARAEWWQLGMAGRSGRLYEFRCSDPVNFVPFNVLLNPGR